LEITFKDEYTPLIKTPLSLCDYIPKGSFDSCSSNDDNSLEDEAVQCCMVSWAHEWEDVKANPVNTTQELNQETHCSGHQLQPLEVGKR